MQKAGLTELFRHNPVADLRTPQTTFDSFCRAILTEEPSSLWQTMHPDQRHLLQRRFHQEGSARFFERMAAIISSAKGRLRLGTPDKVVGCAASCPIYRASETVGTAWFSFLERTWLLTSLS